MMLVRDPTDWIEEAQRRSDRLFLRTLEGRDFSYAALRELSGRIAGVLQRRGVQSGDRVAVQVDKSAEAVFLYVACLRIGAVFVPINVANTPNEVEYYLRDSQPRVAIVRPQDRALLEPLARQAQVGCVETLGADGTGSLLRARRRVRCGFLRAAPPRERRHRRHHLHLRHDRPS